MNEENEKCSWWPQPGDKLFACGTDWNSEALLNRPRDWFLHYASGYKEAANAVVAAVQARDLSPDSAVYPVCYLYRHYLELLLKGLINVGTMLKDRTSDYPKLHDIGKLWQVCRPLLEDACPEGDEADTNAVERCIKELTSIDPSGEGFRYGETKDGGASLRGGAQFSLLNMREVMNRIAGFLEGSYDWMYELLQYQADIDSEVF